MRKKISLWGVILALGAVLLMAPAPAPAATMELMLLVDISGSISTSEFNLQRSGYANAFTTTVANLFNDPNITVDPFYVSYGVWSGQNQQAQLVGWTYISDAASSIAFGNAIGASGRPYSGLTAVQNALIWGTGLFNNGIASDRQVIDISGDGVANDGLGGTVGRTAALAAGIDTINGLVIGDSVGGSIYNYYLNNVIGGTNPLLMTAADFATFGGAVAQKITFEVIGVVPVPPSVLLLGSGLLGLVGLGWRRRRS